MKKIAYLAIDVHTRHCVLGQMDFNGTFVGTRTFPTSEQNIIKSLKAVKAKGEYLAVEESNLAYWVAQVASPYVTEVVPWDPKENALIYRSSNPLRRTLSRVHARLNTQGKIIAVMYGMWKTGEAYRAQLFLDSLNSGVA